ncbi:MAG TPA: serine protease, partial [Actinomycetes bacterium]
MTEQTTLSHEPLTHDDPWRPPAPPQEPPMEAPAEAGRPRRGVTALIAVALAAGLVGGGAGAALTATALDDEPATASTGAESLRASTASRDVAPAAGSVEQVAAAVLPSVVSIEVSTGA